MNHEPISTSAGRVPDGLKDVSSHLQIPCTMFELLARQFGPDTDGESPDRLLSILFDKCTRNGRMVDSAVAVMISSLWNALRVSLEYLEPEDQRIVLEHLVSESGYARDHTIVSFYRQSFGDIIDDDETASIRVSAAMCFDSSTISNAIVSFVNTMTTMLDVSNDEVVLKIEELPHELTGPWEENAPTAVRFFDVHKNQVKLTKAVLELKESPDER